MADSKQKPLFNIVRPSWSNGRVWLLRSTLLFSYSSGTSSQATCVFSVMKILLWWPILESIQEICKRPTYRFEDTIVWERWHFLIQGIIRVFVHLPCPSSNLVYRSFESTLIFNNNVFPSICNVDQYFELVESFESNVIFPFILMFIIGE